jgi:hypothetical protein
LPDPSGLLTKSLKMIGAKAFKPDTWFLAGAKRHKRKIINNGG